MKVLILVPIWKRPEITKIWADWHFSNLPSNVSTLCILSNDDPYIKENAEIIYDTKALICGYNNFPLGQKLNAGIEFALRFQEFDYLMNLGSDDLLHPAIWGLYYSYMADKQPFFGLNKVYFYDTISNQLALSKVRYWGAGRVISREILEKIQIKGKFLYKNDFSSGLDTNSIENIKSMLNIDYLQVNTHDFPYIVDIKSNEGISDFTLLSRFYDLVDFDILKDYYPEYLINQLHG